MRRTEPSKKSRQTSIARADRRRPLPLARAGSDLRRHGVRSVARRRPRYLIRNLGSVLVMGFSPRASSRTHGARGLPPPAGKTAISTSAPRSGRDLVDLHARSSRSGVWGVALGRGSRTRVVAMTYHRRWRDLDRSVPPGLNFAAVRGSSGRRRRKQRMGISTPFRKQTAAKSLAPPRPAPLRTGSPGSPWTETTSSRLEAATDAVRRARAGEGPTLLEAKTYRMKGHAEA